MGAMARRSVSDSIARERQTARRHGPQLSHVPGSDVRIRAGERRVGQRLRDRSASGDGDARVAARSRVAVCAVPSRSRGIDPCAREVPIRSRSRWDAGRRVSESLSRSADRRCVLRAFASGSRRDMIRIVPMAIRSLRFPALLTATTLMVLATGLAAAGRQAADRKVDALTLAIAVRDGKAKQYEGFTVTGQGRSFDANCTPADPAKKIDASIPLTLGVLGKDGKPQPVVTLEEVVTFQTVGRPMLLVKLRGAKLE